MNRNTYLLLKRNKKIIPKFNEKLLTKNENKLNDNIIKQLYLFSASSANDPNNMHLWVKGASLFIPQMNMLLNHINYNLDIKNITDFKNDSIELKNIFTKNKSDKSTVHNYHIIYSYIFNNLGRNNTLNIFEVGLGTNNPSLVSSMGSNGRPGASLYAFRDYLPYSNIYGADIDKNILFNSNRIKTYYVDQLNFRTFNDFSNNVNNIKFDLIIDDGLHAIGANFNTLLFALDNIKEKGWIVIEDIQNPENWKAIDYILSSNPKYKRYFIKTQCAYIYVINNL
jgi:hypothetical protein